jgi:hypothetical protein
VHYRNFHKENQKIIDEIDRKHEQLETTARRCKILNQCVISSYFYFHLGLTVINQLQNINGMSILMFIYTDFLLIDSLSDDLFDGSSASNDTSMSSDDADERKNIQLW